MIDFSVMLVTAAVGFGLAHWFRFPVIPLLMAPGMALSLLGVRLEEASIETALELGLTFLVFASGIEMNPQRFQRQRQAVLWVGVIQFVVTGLAGYGLAIALGYRAITALYIGFALTASSTLVVLRRLKRQRQMFEPFGRLVTGVLLVQDLLLIVIIVMLERVPEGGASVALGFTWTLGLMGLGIFCQRWLVPRLLERLKLDEETLLVSVLAVLFLFIALAFYLNLPPLVGAFVGGFSFSAFPINGVVRGQISSLSDFFLAVFFTALGAVIVWPDGMALIKAATLALMVVVLTPPLVTLVAEWTGLSARSAVESGLLLAQNSEFSLVLGLNGLLLNHITSEVFSIITIVMVVTMSLTPFVATDGVTTWLLHLHPLRRRRAEESPYRDHILMLGFGAGGMWILKPLVAARQKVLVVDDDPAIISQLRQSRVECIRGDGADERVLERAGAERARLILAGMRRVKDAEKVLSLVRGVPVIVRVFEEEDAKRIQRLGGTPILNSMAAADTFMEWYEKIGRHARREPSSETTG